MNKKNVICLFLLILVGLLTSCISEESSLKYSAPSKSQVSEFISKNYINALSIKETSDFTIVLFENGQESGHYILYKDQNNKLYSSWVKGISDPKESPIFLGGVASGKIPFVTVIINDADILQRAKEIDVTFSDGGVAKEIVTGKGTIITYKNEKNEKPILYSKLVIYDKEMKKLYE
ncbi:hypothetical protein [Clostridium sp.]|uniref:hypothetical protein n=1 Tax=Clostridium sp. TaxID=1506 RepID=UPI002FC9EADE